MRLWNLHALFRYTLSCPPQKMMCVEIVAQFTGRPRTIHNLSRDCESYHACVPEINKSYISTIQCLKCWDKMILSFRYMRLFKCSLLWNLYISFYVTCYYAHLNIKVLSQHKIILYKPEDGSYFATGLYNTFSLSSISIVQMK